jgi:hypothetical protein
MRIELRRAGNACCLVGDHKPIAGIHPARRLGIGNPPAPAAISRCFRPPTKIRTPAAFISASSASIARDIASSSATDGRSVGVVNGNQVRIMTLLERSSGGPATLPAPERRTAGPRPRQVANEDFPAASGGKPPRVRRRQQPSAGRRSARLSSSETPEATRCAGLWLAMGSPSGGGDAGSDHGEPLGVTRKLPAS